MSVDLASLNTYLADKSYIEGYTPSQADVTVFKSLSGSKPDAQYPHAARWYSHIESYSSQHSSLPGDSSKSAEDLVPKAASGSGSAPKAAAPAAAEEDDDEVDLFGSDEEDDAEAEKLKAERVAAYQEKKAGKPKAAAKSVVTFEVKPWDDETDMKALEAAVRSIEKDGLVWGLSKLVPVGYGVSKLQITLVIEDDKISTDELSEQVNEFEDYVQSSDVIAMQKL